MLVDSLVVPGIIKIIISDKSFFDHKAEIDKMSDLSSHMISELYSNFIHLVECLKFDFFNFTSLMATLQKPVSQNKHTKSEESMSIVIETANPLLLLTFMIKPTLFQ